LRPASKARAEFAAPAPASDRLVRHGHAALEEQLFDVAQAQLEAEIPTHCATDDASRKTVPRKIVTDQLRSYPAAKAEIPELASVKHVFVKAAARLNLRRVNALIGCWSNERLGVWLMNACN
jgi:hypothetical protein